MTNTGSNGSPESDRASSERTYSKVPLEKYLDLRQRVLGVREIYKPPGVQEQTPEKRKVGNSYLLFFFTCFIL